MSDKAPDRNTLDINPSYELEISADGYQAFITVHKPTDDSDISFENLKEYLKKHEVTFGLIDAAIESIFKDKKFDRKILIATGEKAVDGKDGKIKYFFDPAVKPVMDDSENVNYKELNLVKNAEKGQKLAEAVPPVEGKEGCTVTGKKVPPRIGKPCPLPAGRNTQPDQANPNILVAAIDGRVLVKGKAIEIDPALSIKGDIDFSTGNVHFVGPVTINGDVKSGFSVKSEHNIQINGVVEDAIIESGGNVFIKTGFTGRGGGKITAKGTVTVKFCENETIISESDVFIGEYAMHCNIQTKGRLIVTGQKGLIAGGEAYALKGVEAKTIGNQNFVPTRIFVGIDKAVNDKIKEKRTALEKHAHNKKEIEKAQFLLLQRKLIKKELPEDKKILLDKLKSVKARIESEEKDMLLAIESLQNELNQFKDATVKVIDVVYPGTMIAIFNATTNVAEALKKVVYRYQDGEVAGVDMAAFEQKQ